MAYANSADPDQSAPEGVYTVCHSTKSFKKQLHKNQNLGQKHMHKVFEILGHLHVPYPQ